MQSANHKQESVMANDPLNDLSMKPSRDDLASRKQSQQKTRKRSTTVTVGDNTPVQTSRNGPLLAIILLVVLGAGAGGWFMWQQMESLSAELKQSKLMLTESQTSMGDLKQNLASQSESLSKTGSEVESDLKLHISEIRKLWDLSNKRNKPAIEINKTAISSLKSSLAQQKKLAAKATETAAAAQASVNGLQSQLKEGQLQTAVINTQVSEMESQLSELNAQNKALKTLITSQEKSLQALQESNGAALQATLKEILQRLDSVDAHRRQVNARLDQHDRNISELYKKP